MHFEFWKTYQGTQLQELWALGHYSTDLTLLTLETKCNLSFIEVEPQT